MRIISILTLSLVLFLTGLSPHAHAAFIDRADLVISDIDDTIKDTRSYEPYGLIGRALSTKNFFADMSEAYKQIYDSARPYFTYVSAAHNLYMKNAHKQLLANGQFPAGTLKLRDLFENKVSHKVEEITKLILRYKPYQVVLVGDNVEYDSEVYNIVKTKFPEIEFAIFIKLARPKHQGSKITPGQFVVQNGTDIVSVLQRLN